MDPRPYSTRGASKTPSGRIWPQPHTCIDLAKKLRHIKHFPDKASSIYQAHYINLLLKRVNINRVVSVVCISMKVRVFIQAQSLFPNNSNDQCQAMAPDIDCARLGFTNDVMVSGKYGGGAGVSMRWPPQWIQG